MNPSRFISVLLPEPEGKPMIATNSPGGDCQVNAREGVDILVTDAVRLPHIMKLDEP